MNPDAARNTCDAPEEDMDEDEGEDGSWEVDEILERKVSTGFATDGHRAGAPLCRVSWVGRASRYNAWVREESVPEDLLAASILRLSFLRSTNPARPGFDSIVNAAAAAAETRPRPVHSPQERAALAYAHSLRVAKREASKAAVRASPNSIDSTPHPPSASLTAHLLTRPPP